MLQDNARFRCRGALSYGLVVGLWLTLALEACSGSTASTPASGGAGAGAGGKSSGGAVHQGGTSSAGKTSGGGGQALGGEGGVAGQGGEAGEAGEGPQVIGLEHQPGVWLVKFASTEGFYTLSCGDGPSLVERDPPDDAASLPLFGEFFVDGEYFDIPPNLGCDFQECESFPTQIGISDKGYVSAGTLPRPDGQAGAGGEAGVGGAGAGGDLPAFATYEIDGPFVLTNRYFTDPDCEQLVAREPQVLTPR
jgi:hypothetical protein